MERIYWILILACIADVNFAFQAKILRLPLPLQMQMKKSTWRTHCPLPLQDLRLLKLSYWGFDHQTHQGSLIVNKVLAKEIVCIFKALYEHQFPIARMQLMDDYQGNDNAAMAANNTSAFNCRQLTGHPGYFSQHSYGRAIDINPIINPYVGKTATLPAEGVPFIDRNQTSPGKITKKSYIYKLFSYYGWDWGGHWIDVQDYQHFEKRAYGKKRNPYGYSPQVKSQ